MALRPEANQLDGSAAVTPPNRVQRSQVSFDDNNQQTYSPERNAEREKTQNSSIEGILIK